ncbi:TetR/AcrR family transcriptional regulator [Neobacillus sp. LXY-4]|uniref:TetR/AcrR family transcriptional regulator n=1 Tax=Neobacillus sp. LXY-4 TaxID=3379826 RepID=UPI003EE3F54A
MLEKNNSSENRKQQIMAHATRLFNEHGYEKTSVNTIISEVNIAKGTFYHYFKSKDDLLNEIIDHFYDEQIVEIKQISQDLSLDSFEKINKILKKLINPSSQSSPFPNYIDDDRANKIHSTLEERFRFHFHPILTAVVQGGIDNHVFQLQFPEEVCEILLIGIQGYIHYHLPHFADQLYAYKKLTAIEELFNIVLVNQLGKISLL